MTIEKIIENETATIKISGRLDTATAPEFEREVDSLVDSVKKLIIDMNELEYTSSAGLRVILKAKKMMDKRGNMKLINVNNDIMEVFDITGFLDILTIG
jgi:anti-sigma B factor antagonist